MNRPNCGVSFLQPQGRREDVTRHELAVRRNPSYVKSDSIRLAVVRRTRKVLLECKSLGEIW